MKKNGYVWIILAVGLVLFVSVLWEFLGNDKVLLTTDAMIKKSNVSFIEMVQGIGPRWKSSPLLGAPQGGGTSISWMSKGLMPTGILWNNSFYGLMCLCAFVVLSIYLRRRGGAALGQYMRCDGRRLAGEQFYAALSGARA